MKLNTLTNPAGWIVFAISLLVYILTLEPANSLWDCSEFIACAYKLQVSHSPGAPFFMLVARLFTLFAGHDVQKAALMVNLFSAISSAFTVFFLFHTIVLLAEKIQVPFKIHEYKLKILIIAAGIIGSLAFAFTDSFWFSAVEAEVYAFSSFLTALVFWAILKWDNQKNNLYAMRWLIFISFIIGLSIGVHLLNLLAIPAIVFILYSKNRQLSRYLIIKIIVVSVLALGGIMYLFIPGIAKSASVTDLVCVNIFGMPVNSGLYIAFVIIGVILTILLKNAIKKKNIARQTAILSLLFMTAGYSSYLSVLFRSGENISINMNSPDNPFSLYHFLNREHYGSRPLFYGPYYNAPVTKVEERTSYIPFKGKYISTNLNPVYHYNKRFMTLFPRLSDNSGQYSEAYKRWAKIKGEKVTVNMNGKTETMVKPTFQENLRFFIKYQVGYMYWRYFFWNFAGRQDDVQGMGNSFHGNWLSGIGFIDSIRLGKQSGLPASKSENKARNRYYFLPLLLGISGLLWHYRNHKNGFTAVLLLFFFTGIAITIYLNEIPLTPRERDYVYAGSYYAFAVWIGIGTLSVYSFFQKYMPVLPSLAFSLVISMIVPVLLIKENYDDHDRSGRYAARDFGYNYLNSCSKNAILFTNGDNDTYPLWYIQEVESVRPDIRVVLQPYLGAEWYIDQMRNDMNDAAALPMSFNPEKFHNNNRSFIQIINRIDSSTDLNEALSFIRSDDRKTRIFFNDSNYRDYLPARRLKLNIDKDILRQSGNFSDDELARTEDAIYFTVNKNYLLRSDLLILDIMAQNNWKRPLYFLSPLELRNLGLDKYLVREGLAYRLVPYPSKHENSIYGYSMDVESTQNKLMEIFRWGNINHPGVYNDYTIRRQLDVMGIRRTFSQLADSLVKTGEKESALKILDKCMEVMPLNLNPEDYYIPVVISLYFEAGNAEKGIQYMNEYALTVNDELTYYVAVEKRFKKEILDIYRNYLYYLNELLKTADLNAVAGFKEKYGEIFRLCYEDFQR